MNEPTPPAAPAPPTPDPFTPTVPLNELSGADERKWRETGELPAREVASPDDDAVWGDEPVPAIPAPGAPVSKRQQRINEQIRTAVEAATKADKDELARLRAAQTAPRPEPPKPPPAPALKADATDPEPDATDTEKYPGGEYDPKYIRAAAAWDIRQENRKTQAEAHQRAQAAHRDEQFRGSAKATSDAFAARTAADPDFVKRLDQSLMTRLIPISQLPEDLPAGPFNVIAEELMAHPDTAPDVTEYLSTHPEDVARLTALDPRTGVPLLSARALIRELGRIEGALKRGVEPPPLPNTITHAPSPPTTLGSRSTTPVDAAESALKSGNFEAYRAAENAKELAARRT